MRRIWLASIAAAAVITPAVAFTAVAQAAPSKDTTRFCTVPASMRNGCSIEVPITAKQDGVREGSQVKALLRGAPNQTINFAVFHITFDASGKPTKLTRVSKPTPASLDKSGNATVQIQVDALKSPMTGGPKDFVVATADTMAVDGVPGTVTRRWDQFAVNSARGKFMGAQLKPVNGRHYTPQENIAYKVDSAIPGHRYLVQLKLNNQWVTMNSDSPQNNGTVTNRSSALVHWSFKGVPAGKYDLRVSNAANPNDPIHSGSFEILAQPGVPTATPTKPGTATPTKPGTATPTASPSKPGTPTTKPSTTGTPRATASPTPSAAPTDARQESRMVGPDGTGAPEYTMNGNVMTSRGKLVDAKGQPISGATIEQYVVTNGKRGARLGGTHPNADGSFTLTVTLPNDWQAAAGFNVELTHVGNAQFKPVSYVMRPEVTTGGQTPSPETTAPAPKPEDDKPKDEKPEDKPQDKESEGGLAKTGR